MNQPYRDEGNLVSLNGLPNMDAAAAYMQRGWFPTPTRNDVPILQNWETLRLTPENLGLFGDADIGLVLGQTSGGLYVVNVDDPQVVHLVPSCLPSTSAKSVRPGRPGSQYFYHATNPVERNRYTDVDGGVLIELQSDGQHTVVPPSRYGTNGSIVWVGPGPPAEICATELVKAVKGLAARALLRRHWNSSQELAFALSGGLLRARWHPDDVANLIGAVATEAGDGEVGKRVECVYQTQKKLGLKEYVTGFPTAGRIIGCGVVDSFKSWLGIGDDTIAVADLLLMPVVDTDSLPMPDCPYHKPLVSQRGAFKVWVTDCRRWSCRPCAEDKARAILRRARQLFTSEVWYGAFPLNPKLIANLRQRRRRGGAPSLWVKRYDGLHVFSPIDLRGTSPLLYGGQFVPPDAGLLFLQQIALKLPGPVEARGTGSWSPSAREDKKSTGKWEAPVGNVSPRGRQVH